MIFVLFCLFFVNWVSLVCVLNLAERELIIFIAAHIVVCFGFVTTPLFFTVTFPVHRNTPHTFPIPFSRSSTSWSCMSQPSYLCVGFSFPQHPKGIDEGTGSFAATSHEQQGTATWSGTEWKNWCEPSPACSLSRKEKWRHSANMHPGFSRWKELKISGSALDVLCISTRTVTSAWLAQSNSKNNNTLQFAVSNSSP